MPTPMMSRRRRPGGSLRGASLPSSSYATHLPQAGHATPGGVCAGGRARELRASILDAPPRRRRSLGGLWGRAELDALADVRADEREQDADGSKDEIEKDGHRSHGLALNEHERARDGHEQARHRGLDERSSRRDHPDQEAPE